MNKKNKHTAQSIPSPSERARVRLKVCGMKYPDNIKQVAALQPDYLGFIFYEKSTRHFNGDIPDISKSIKKVGVFVDADLNNVLKKINTYNLQAVQLHGHESPEYCEKLKRHYEEGNSKVIPSKDTDCFNSKKESRNVNHLEIIKVFSIKDNFNFDLLKPYESVCDYFLFDTKGKLPGGNGYTFDWNVLKEYPSKKPFFLSGGIGMESLEDIKRFQKSKASKYCYAIDVNSRFEIEPGLKHIEKLKDFKNSLSFRT